jgi:phosphotransferase system HPr (HPr) family protein
VQVALPGACIRRRHEANAGGLEVPAFERHRKTPHRARQAVPGCGTPCVQTANPMQTRKLLLAKSSGLHAEACARIVSVAKRCRCRLSLVVNGRRVSARSIVAVMVLAASVRGTVRVEADGPDEDLAIQQIATLFHDGLGEGR